MGGGIRLIVGFQPLMVISPTASWIRWRMQVYAWWLGVREAGVRSPTASHQRGKTGRFALLSLALGINELGNRLGGSEPV